MENVKDDVLSIVSEELEVLKERIVANHRAACQVASGRTIESMKVERTEDGGILWGRNAFGTLETGRKPGKVPKGFSDIILQWMEDKGIKANHPKSFAFLVARKISEEGTKLFRDGGRNDIYSPEIIDTMESISERIGLRFGTEVEHINLNFNEDSNI